LEKIRISFEVPSSDVIVLHGPPGVGKSELAREFARRRHDAYPGGTFIVEAGKQAIVIDLARLGQTMLDPDILLPGMTIGDQCLRTLAALAAAPTLLIYDNVQAEEAVIPWLPRAGTACHALITMTLDRWDAGWRALQVPPLSPEDSIDLIARIAGREVSERYGAQLATLAGGLLVQIVPASVTLAYEARRGRLDAAARGSTTMALLVTAQSRRPKKRHSNETRSIVQGVRIDVVGYAVGVVEFLQQLHVPFLGNSGLRGRAVFPATITGIHVEVFVRTSQSLRAWSASSRKVLTSGVFSKQYLG
jgi:hypothetical protein